MAFTRLQDSDWSVNGNWSGGSTPADGAQVEIPDSLGVNADLGLSTQGANDYAILHTHPGYKHDIGSSGNPLTAAAALIHLQGSGGFYFTCSADAVGQDVNELRMECANNGVPVEIDSEAGDLGDYDKIVALRGSLLVKGTTVFSASAIVQIDHVSNRASDAFVKFATNTDTIPTFEQSGGRCESKIAMTQATVTSGVLRQEDALITTLNVEGGTVLYNHTAMTTCYVKQGVLDLTEQFKDMTITNLTVFPGGTVYGVIKGVTAVDGPITVTTFNNMGGRVLSQNPNRR